LSTLSSIEIILKGALQLTYSGEGIDDWLMLAGIYITEELLVFQNAFLGQFLEAVVAVGIKSSCLGPPRTLQAPEN
jgi:hypothetical protein